MAPTTTVPPGLLVMVSSSVIWPAIHSPRPPSWLGPGGVTRRDATSARPAVGDPEPEPVAGEPHLEMPAAAAVTHRVGDDLVDREHEVLPAALGQSGRGRAGRPPGGAARPPGHRRRSGKGGGRSSAPSTSRVLACARHAGRIFAGPRSPKPWARRRRSRRRWAEARSRSAASRAWRAAGRPAARRPAGPTGRRSRRPGPRPDGPGPVRSRRSRRGPGPPRRPGPGRPPPGPPRPARRPRVVAAPAGRRRRRVRGSASDRVGAGRTGPGAERPTASARARRRPETAVGQRLEHPAAPDQVGRVGVGHRGGQGALDLGQLGPVRRGAAGFAGLGGERTGQGERGVQLGPAAGRQVAQLAGPPYPAPREWSGRAATRLRPRPAGAAPPG